MSAFVGAVRIALLSAVLAVPSRTQESRATASGPKPELRLEGSVLDLGERPLGLAEIVVRRASDACELARVRTDGSGCFVVPRLPRVTLAVRASAELHVSKTVSVEIAPDRSLAICTLRLADARPLLGTVTDETGRPVPGTSVFVTTAFAVVDQDVLEVTTDASGRFECTTAPLGAVNLFALAPDRRVARAKVPRGPAESVPFRLGAGGGITLRITITGATPRQLAAATCSFLAYDEAGLQFLPKGLRLGTPAADGTWLVRDLPPTLSYRAFGAYVPGARSLQNAQAAEPPFLEKEIRRELRLTPTRFSQVQGRLVDREGAPIAGVALSMPVLDEVREVVSADDGTFTVALPLAISNRYAVALGTSTWALDPVPDVRPRSGDGLLDKIHVARGADVSGWELRATHAVTVCGKVVDGDGHPVARVAIRTFDSEVEFSEMAPTDKVATTEADGTFELRGVHPDSLARLRVRASTANQVATSGEPVPTGPRRATLGPLVLRETVLVSGTVRDSLGAAQGGVFVWLQSEGARRGEWHVQEMAFTDREGRYRFERPARGTWRVAVDDDGETGHGDPFVIHGNDPVHEDITLGR